MGLDSVPKEARKALALLFFFFFVPLLHSVLLLEEILGSHMSYCLHASTSDKLMKSLDRTRLTYLNPRLSLSSHQPRKY